MLNLHGDCEVRFASRGKLPPKVDVDKPEGYVKRKLRRTIRRELRRNLARAVGVREEEEEDLWLQGKNT